MDGWKPYQQVRTLTAPPPLPASKPFVTPVVVGAGLKVRRDSVMAAAPSTVTVAGEQVVITPDAEVEPGMPARSATSGTAKIEAFSSWGMVVILLVAMFLFMGVVLRHRPTSLNPRAGLEATEDASDSPATTSGNASPATRSATRNGRPGPLDTLSAQVRMLGSTMTIQNSSSFDWPATTVEFDNADGHYTYKLKGLSRSGSARISMSDFKRSDGKNFGFFSAKPKELKFGMEGFETTTVSFGR
jgi:hypothetical protein